MASRLMRGWFARVAVTAAVIAIPLLAAGSAQAAIAGANPGTTSALPDLRSATLLDSSDVAVCFDKPLSNNSNWLSNFSGFGWLGGYASARIAPPIGVAIEASNNQCVVASFAGVGDLNKYTILTVFPGAVTAVASGSGNNYDSVALTGSTSNDGTTGLTTAANLLGVAAPTSANSSTNSLTYVFDQSVKGPVSADFWMEDTASKVCSGNATPPVVSGTTVTVFFTKTCETIGTARHAGVFTGGITADSDPVPNPDSGVVMPSAVNGGATVLPNLTTTSLESNGNTIDYTFNKPLQSWRPADFKVWLSDGTVGTGTGSKVGGPNQIDITFAGLNLVNEYAVFTSVTGEAVTDQAGDSVAEPAPISATYTNSPDSGAIGGNAGAFARGFTTGPDVFAVSFSQSSTTGLATVSLDQRALTYNAALLTLLRSDGSTLNSAIANPAPLLPPAGPEAITVQFPLTAMPQAAMLALTGYGAFTSPLGGADGESVPQIVQPISTAAILRAYHERHHAKKHSKKHSKKHAKKH